MSIEIKLSFNTLEEAVATLARLQPTYTPFPLPESNAEGAPSPEKLVKAASNKPKPPADNTAGVKALLEAAPTPAAETKPEAPAVTYPMLQKAVFALAAKDRNAALEVAVQFGVSNFKDLPEARWAEALTLVQAKVDAL